MKSRLPAALAMLVVLLLSVVPLGALAWRGLNPQPDPFSGVVPGLFDAVGSWAALELLIRSGAMAAAVAGLALPAGTWLAWCDARLAFRGRRLLLMATLLPLAMPSFVLASSVALGLSRGGWLPLFDRVAGMGAAVAVLAVVTTPYVQLVVGSALARSSAAEEEAARTLGAGRWRVFADVVLPRIRPALGYGGLLAMLYAISDFGAVAVLDAPVLTWRLYQAVAAASLQKAAVLGGALLVATLPLFAVSRLIGGRSGAASVANPRPAARRRATLGEQVTVWTVGGLVAGLGVFLPVVTMVGWVADGLRRGLPFAPLGGPVLDTLLAASLGAVFTLLLAVMPGAVVGARRRTGWLDLATYLTSALPGVLLAFGWMLAALMLGSLLGPGSYAWMLSSGLLLGLGYATRFVAEAYTPIKTTVWAFDPRWHAAHRTLGARSGQFLWEVALPRATPGLAAALLLGFLAVLKELPVTLLLGGATGLNTLAFRVWDRSSEALWHDAGAAGLLLLGLALGAVAASLPWRKGV